MRTCVSYVGCDIWPWSSGSPGTGNCVNGHCFAVVQPRFVYEPAYRSGASMVDHVRDDMFVVVLGSSHVRILLGPLRFIAFPAL